MKQLIVLLLLIVGGFSTSCTSEYEERLEEGLHLKERISVMERSNAMLADEYLMSEIESMRNQIDLLARVSGDEELFLTQVYED
ncbi:MAG: hypothetical protein QNK23_02855 [Crocinitomicaceae bacterium]|nr:hypothetical protein [Crocinitomicaceae bacterium]